jgi:hypothetical protein
MKGSSKLFIVFLSNWRARAVLVEFGAYVFGKCTRSRNRGRLRLVDSQERDSYDVGGTGRNLLIKNPPKLQLSLSRWYEWLDAGVMRLAQLYSNAIMRM